MNNTPSTPGSNPEIKLQTASLVILAIVAVAASLYLLRPVMIPFILAVFFTMILTPIVDLQVRHFKVPNGLALFVTLIIGLILFTLVGLLISASVQQMVANADQYQQQIEELIQKSITILNLERFGVDKATLMEPIQTGLRDNIGGWLGKTINAIVGLMSKGILVLIFVVFLLIGRRKTRKPTGAVWLEGESRVNRYIVTKVLLSAITGFLVGLVLTILNIDLALVFGLFAFILNFIPSIGSIIATLLPLPVVIVSPDISPMVAVLAIVIPGAIQFSIGNLLEPKIMGESLDLHPVVILMALIFWGMIWGVVGMLLAAPLTAIMKIIFQNIELTKPIADLMAGRIEAIQH